MLPVPLLATRNLSAVPAVTFHPDFLFTSNRQESAGTTSLLPGAPELKR